MKKRIILVEMSPGIVLDSNGNYCEAERHFTDIFPGEDVKALADAWDQGFKASEDYEKAAWDQVLSLTKEEVPELPKNPYRTS